MLKKFLIFFILPITIISVLFNIKFYNYFRKQNLVVQVVDGDTFQLASGKRVRLMGVDAPEYNRCGGPEGKKRLTELILNKEVSLKESQQETFGRSLALVYTSTQFINELMLRDGWGVPDYRKNSQRDILTAAYHEAKTNKRGIFSLCKEQPNITPSNPSCLIKGNIDKNTYKKYFHLPGCRQYNQIVIDKDIGERYFCTEQEAIAAGFVKASGCP